MGESSPSFEYAKGLIRLLKEYSEKLNTLLSDVNEDDKHAHWSQLGEFFDSMRGGLMDLSRRASELADQKEVEPIHRVELRIRRAEIESLIRSVERAFGS
jgi:hypothetical protein